MEGTDYTVTTYDYETFTDGGCGRPIGTESPDGKITRYVLDAGGNVLETWIGTNDEDALDSNPGYRGGGANDNANNMVKVSSSTYDAAGNMLTSTSYANAGTSYTTTYHYDWQGRLTDTLSPDNVVSHTEYNDLGQVEYQQTYASTDFTLSAGELRAQTEYFYDNLGRTYETRTYEVDVDPTTHTGTLGDYLTTQTWYDAAGRVVKTANANGLFQKTSYDSLGRAVASYTCYDADEGTASGTELDKYNRALNVLGDTVIEQNKVWYYSDRNAVLAISYQRLPNTAIEGALTPANSFASSYVTWADVLGRTIATVAYGRESSAAGATHYVFDPANGDFIDSDYDNIPNELENAPRQPDTSDDYIVSQTEYDTAGRAYRTIDNLNRINQTDYDAAGRTVRTIQNRDDGAVAETDTACDLTTEYQYDSAGRLVMMTAMNAKGTGKGVEFQTTTYLYESPLDPSLPTNVIYADSADWSPISLSQASGVATVTTSANDWLGCVPGDWVLIQGASDGGCNGSFQVSTVDANNYTFTYALPAGASASTSDAYAMVAWKKAAQLEADPVYSWELRDYIMVATVTVANDYSAGDWVLIQGADRAELNGWFQIESSNAALFTYVIPTDARWDHTDYTGYVHTRLADQTFTTYDQLGRVTSTTDQRGVIHAYTFDTAGRPMLDAVENTAAALDAMGVDSDILAIGRTYDDVGRLNRLTSYHDAAGTDEANEVAYRYDGWGNLVREWQSHEGSVDTQTTPSVQYTYSDGLGTAPASEAAKYVRLTEVVYPNGRVVHYDYGNAGTVDDIMSRLATISDSQGTLAAYDYLGSRTIAIEDYADIAVKLDYTGANNSMSGFDRFGRVADQVWADYGISPETLDEYRYGYDCAGNRVWKENAGPGATNLDELYTYDALNQLLTARRGQLNTGHTDIVANTEQFAQDWTLDALGNMSNFQEATQGTLTLDQYRAANAANEIDVDNNHANAAGASITADTGADWYDPTYDAAGNTITAPKPGEPTTALTLKYDAWNRTSQISEVTLEGSILLGRYEYDGQNRRILKVARQETPDGIGGTVVNYNYEHFYLNGQQVVETRENLLSAVASQNGYAAATSLGNTAVRYQFINSPRYIDALILRDEYSGGTIQTAERLFYLSDANYNVTGLVKKVGAVWQVRERYAYDAYGKTLYLALDWTELANQVSAFNNTNLYTGRTLDLETGLLNYRARLYHADLMRFLGRDPLGYGARDANLYRYCGNRPLIAVDPSGMESPQPLAWGNAAHKAIETAVINANDFFASRYKVDKEREITTIARKYRDSVGSYGTHFLGRIRNRVDLIAWEQAPGKCMGPELFEIKPIEELSAGAVQLGGYVRILRTPPLLVPAKKGSRNVLGLSGKVPVPFVGTLEWQFKGDGMITYRWLGPLDVRQPDNVTVPVDVRVPVSDPWYAPILLPLIWGWEGGTKVGGAILEGAGSIIVMPYNPYLDKGPA